MNEKSVFETNFVVARYKNQGEKCKCARFVVNF